MTGTSEPVLGRLATVEPRTVWPHEAHDFTPWLLDNADRLGEALGLEVELDAPEHPVGGFSLDLIGRDLSNGGLLIVENQLAGTDHGHLGQLLTYAAGTGAATIVWIATAFRDEHRQALDWLNESTGEETRFFGVRLGVVQIGDSALAPLFELAATPNNWQKQVRASARESSGNGSAYRSFWTRFLERLRAERPGWSRARSAPSQNWFSMSGPIRGTQLNASFAAGSRLRSEVYIDTGDQQANEAIFDALVARRTEIESAYGQPLEFEGLPNRRAKRIARYRPGSVLTEAEFEEYTRFFLDAGTRMRRAMAAVELVQIVEAATAPHGDDA